MNTTKKAETVAAVPFTLADAIDLFDDSSAFTFGVREGEMGGDEDDLTFLDESGLRGNDCDAFFLAGQEFGATHLIHARSFECAWEAWIDESPTIPESELIEAYGIVDDYRTTFDALPSPEGEPTAAWCERFYAACRVELARLGDLAHAGQGDYPELIEGYEMQSNCTGTGIVNVGSYAWMREVDPSHVVVTRKSPSK